MAQCADMMCFFFVNFTKVGFSGNGDPQLRKCLHKIGDICSPTKTINYARSGIYTPDNVILGREYWRTLELWTGRAIVYLELNGLFWGILEGKNAEKKADDGTLACEVLEGSKDPMRDVYTILNLESMLYG